RRRQANFAVTQGSPEAGQGAVEDPDGTTSTHEPGLSGEDTGYEDEVFEEADEATDSGRGASGAGVDLSVSETKVSGRWGGERDGDWVEEGDGEREKGQCRGRGWADKDERDSAEGEGEGEGVGVEVRVEVGSCPSEQVSPAAASDADAGAFPAAFPGTGSAGDQGPALGRGSSPAIPLPHGGVSGSGSGVSGRTPTASPAPIGNGLSTPVACEGVEVEGWIDHAGGTKKEEEWQGRVSVSGWPSEAGEGLPGWVGPGAALGQSRVTTGQHQAALAHLRERESVTSLPPAPPESPPPPSKEEGEDLRHGIRFPQAMVEGGDAASDPAPTPSPMPGIHNCRPIRPRSPSPPPPPPSHAPEEEEGGEEGKKCGW
ncbi:unnamed protein product, partial [Discosporangium mesarthrocarpum]